MNLSRRSLLRAGGLILVAAPFVSRMPGVLMPVRAAPVMPPKVVAPATGEYGWMWYAGSELLPIYDPQFLNNGQLRNAEADRLWRENKGWEILHSHDEVVREISLA